jgi:nucleotide-binding universal stress UspA family protein
MSLREIIRTLSKIFVAKETGTASHKSVVVDGDPASRIIDFAQEYKADLTRNAYFSGTVRRFLIGSVTAKLLNDVECPVVTGVHHYDDSPQVPDALRTIMCALDNAPGCLPPFHWAREFATALGARLKPIHALPAVDETSDNCGEVEIRRYLLSKAKKDFSARFGMEREPVAVDLHGGDIPTVVRESALAERADLVVIGRGHANREF